MKNQTCLVIGASHAGVSFAFALRKEGWEGKILLFDSDPLLPYHRPPLSKAFLTDDQELENYCLRSLESYEEEQIELHLGTQILKINTSKKSIVTDKNETFTYNKLVFATGSRALIPAIRGIEECNHIYTLRTATDALRIKAIATKKNVIIIGDGYIGLEIAASLQKTGATITLLEREIRILCRVTAPEVSQYFHDLHTSKGVQIQTQKEVIEISETGEKRIITCASGEQFEADIIIVGVGVKVNLELAAEIGLEIKNGIVINGQCRTSDPDIYAIGDCTYHENLYYQRHIRLESVQNAIDQAKIAASFICGKEVNYDSLPWFWSDQYYVKLQIVGLSAGYTEVIIRKEQEEDKLSAWYFNHEKLLAVDAINHAKAYVIGTKILKDRILLNKTNLRNTKMQLSLENLKQT